MHKVALVTGASRGIGRRCALWLADAGFDVAVAARTLRPGQSQDTYSDGTPFAGSLAETALEIESRGRKALPLEFDLCQRDGARRVVATLLDAWGRVDVLVNNALYSPGSMNARILDADPTEILRTLDANVITQLVLTQRCAADMVERGEGVIINMTSAAAWLHPPAPHGEGGWSFGYSALKAAFTRLTPHLHIELAERGVRSYALEPGGVLTDSFKAAFTPETLPVLIRNPKMHLVSDDVPASVVAWLATSKQAAALSGSTLDCEEVCREQGLLPEERIVVRDLETP